MSPMTTDTTIGDAISPLYSRIVSSYRFTSSRVADIIMILREEV